MITGVIRIRAIASRLGKEVKRLLNVGRCDDTGRAASYEL
jgi:hypothetical protein